MLYDEIRPNRQILQPLFKRLTENSVAQVLTTAVGYIKLIRENVNN